MDFDFPSSDEYYWYNPSPGNYSDAVGEVFDEYSQKKSVKSESREAVGNARSILKFCSGVLWGIYGGRAWSSVGEHFAVVLGHVEKFVYISDGEREDLKNSARVSYCNAKRAFTEFVLELTFCTLIDSASELSRELLEHMASLEKFQDKGEDVGQEREKLFLLSEKIFGYSRIVQFFNSRFNASSMSLLDEGRMKQFYEEFLKNLVGYKFLQILLIVRGDFLWNEYVSEYLTYVSLQKRPGTSRYDGDILTLYQGRRREKRKVASKMIKRYGLNKKRYWRQIAAAMEKHNRGISEANLLFVFPMKDVVESTCFFSSLSSHAHDAEWKLRGPPKTKNARTLRLEERSEIDDKWFMW